MKAVPEKGEITTKGIVVAGGFESSRWSSAGNWGNPRPPYLDAAIPDPQSPLKITVKCDGASTHMGATPRLVRDHSLPHLRSGRARVPLRRLHADFACHSCHHRAGPAKHPAGWFGKDYVAVASSGRTPFPDPKASH